MVLLSGYPVDGDKMVINNRCFSLHAKKVPNDREEVEEKSLKELESSRRRWN